MIGDARLDVNKNIYIDTNTLSFSAMNFTAEAAWNTASQQGINGIDDSFWTTLEIEFKIGRRQLFKGSGNITIEQKKDDFRLPAVITEAQYNRLRNVSGIDTYYTRGTNGVYPSGEADTSTKYILGYNINPAATNNENNALTNFREAFRQAEKISISVDLTLFCCYDFLWKK